MYNNWSEMKTTFVIFFHEIFAKQHNHLNWDYFFVDKNKASNVRWLIIISTFQLKI